jgi:hypothetical protein
MDEAALFGAPNFDSSPIRDQLNVLSAGDSTKPLMLPSGTLPAQTNGTKQWP